ncbi:F-box DNA helicase 1-like, partial [Cyanistes caeruleus]|uniref:F-box DNA helicase 1-like n=1 Tax=Cyanistes caeruleus TaxID=156563 RepID=UPI000CDB93D2
MRRSKRRHLTALECRALAESSEVPSALRQPQRLERGIRGLRPIPRPRSRSTAPGRQRSILDFCGIRSHGIEEDPSDPCSPSPPDSCFFQHSQLSVPPPTAHSRKRPLPSGIPTPELDLWDEPQEKIPELLQQEWEELEVEPLPDSHYGLLGTRNWEFPQGSMDSLPAEILRNIFALLPVLDLYQNLSLVCHSWREIIRDPLNSSPNFLGIPSLISMELIPDFHGIHSSPGRQRSILDFCGIRSHGIEEDPSDPCSPSPPDSCLFQHSQLSVPPPTAHSRKRPLPSGIPTPELDLWDEPQEKIPELLQQEWEELEVEPLPDSHYGLLGTRNWEFPQGSMDSLPAEILRNIFALLPVLDLYQNLSLVCHSWREIIRDPLFIPWKKLYHRYLKGERSALQAVEQILQEFSITKENQECVLGLVRLVASKGAKVDPNALLRVLGSHPLFPKAQICVHNKFPDLLSKPGPERMWAIFAVMVLFSDGIGDIRSLLEYFRSCRSELAPLEATEALHCMATVLRAMRDRSIPISN